MRSGRIEIILAPDLPRAIPRAACRRALMKYLGHRQQLLVLRTQVQVVKHNYSVSPLVFRSSGKILSWCQIDRKVPDTGMMREGRWGANVACWIWWSVGRCPDHEIRRHGRDGHGSVHQVNTRHNLFTNAQILVRKSPPPPQKKTL